MAAQPLFRMWYPFTIRKDDSAWLHVEGLGQEIYKTKDYYEAKNIALLANKVHAIVIQQINKGK